MNVSIFHTISELNYDIEFSSDYKSGLIVLILYIETCTTFYRKRNFFFQN